MPSVALSPLEPTATVTVRAEVIADVAVAVTVTVVAEAPSPTLDGLADSVTGGLTSSSTIVTVVPVTVVVRAQPAPARTTVSSPSFVVSCLGVRVKVPVPVV